jgi:hypothetical protein
MFIMGSAFCLLLAWGQAVLAVQVGLFHGEWGDRMYVIMNYTAIASVVLGAMCTVMAFYCGSWTVRIGMAVMAVLYLPLVKSVAEWLIARVVN